MITEQMTAQPYVNGEVVDHTDAEVELGAQPNLH
jgi:hypothetical protein